MSDLRDFIIEILEREQKTFIKALDETPDDLFHQKPPAGGHSAAWHALHVAEWQQISIPKGLNGVDPKKKFAYLGWEDSEFAQKVFGQTEINEKDTKEKIIEHIKQVFSDALENIREVSVEKLSIESKMDSPLGRISTRGRVLGQPMHIAYHRGQLKMAIAQLK